jgi:hypothetical protein
LVEADGCGLEDGLCMERRDDPGAELVNGVSQDDGNAEEVSVRNHREHLAGVGVSFALV